MLEPLGADGAHVHEADRLGIAAKLVAGLEVLVKGGLDHLVVNLDVLELGAEGSVAAVVRPIGVDDANLGDGGVALLAGEVLLAELDIGEVHGQAALGDEAGKSGLVKLGEAGEGLDVFRDGDFHLERGLGGEAGLAGLDGVDDVVLDGLDVGGAKLAGEHVDLRGANARALAGADELYALAGRVGALIELAGQVLDGEDGGAERRRGELADLIKLGAFDGKLGRGGVYLRLAEDDGDAALEEVLLDTLDVVAVDDAKPREAADAKDGAQLLRELLRLHVEARLLLNVGAEDHSSCPSRCWARHPAAAARFRIWLPRGAAVSCDCGTAGRPQPIFHYDARSAPRGGSLRAFPGA